jgi:hypothetical protein
MARALKPIRAGNFTPKRVTGAHMAHENHGTKSGATVQTRLQHLAALVRESQKGKGGGMPWTPTDLPAGPPERSEAWAPGKGGVRHFQLSKGGN